LTSRRRGALAGDEGGAGARVLRLLVLFIATIFRPKALLIAENLCLRQQLVALQRRHPRPRLSNADRRFWILASRWFGGWRNLLLIVKPKTVPGGQRLGWRAHWTWRSSCRTSGGRPAIPAELQALIERMAAENRLGGQKRIQAELGSLHESALNVRDRARSANTRHSSPEFAVIFRARPYPRAHPSTPASPLRRSAATQQKQA
jgi:hypothetical protein